MKWQIHFANLDRYYQWILSEKNMNVKRQNESYTSLQIVKETLEPAIVIGFHQWKSATDQFDF